VRAIGDMLAVEIAGDQRLRYRSADAITRNPLLIARLAEHGIPVVALAEIPRRLEDIYLRIVAGSDVDRGDWSIDAHASQEIAEVAR
jgi:ABC-2 type transport system ATP-binding protein